MSSKVVPSFAADPSSVHFAGYRELNGCIKRRVRITNVSAEAKRLRIKSFEQKSKFRASYANGIKTGAVAPGLSQTIVVEFRPEEFEYEREDLQVYYEGDDDFASEILSIPIHAYPTLGLACTLPRRLDFGKRALGDVVLRSINLQSSAPVAFEYKLEFSSDTQFSLNTSTTGIVPADGLICISIRYIPKRLGTARANLIVHLAQIDAEPHTIHIVANCAPGALHDRIIAASSLPEVSAIQADKKTHIRSILQTIDPKPSSGRRHPPPAPSEMMESQKHKTCPKPTLMTEQVSSTTSQHEALMAALQRPFQKNGLEEFKMALDRCKQRENEVAYRTSVERVGAKLMTEEELRSLKHKFTEICAQNKRKEEEHENNRTEPIFGKYVTREYDQSGNQSLEPLPSSPQFTSTGISWRQRRENLQRLISFVSRVIIRIRAAKRLKCIKQLLDGCTTREQVQTLVENDHKQAQQATSAKTFRPKEDKAPSIDRKILECFDRGSEPSKLQIIDIPKYDNESTSNLLLPRKKLQVKEGIPEFDDIKKLELSPWPELHDVALGRKPHPPPDPCAYFEKELDAELQHGAIDDSSLRPPRGEKMNPMPFQDPGPDTIPENPIVAAALVAARARWFNDMETRPKEMPSFLCSELSLDTECPQRADHSVLLRPPAIHEAHRDWPLFPRPIERPLTMAARVNADRYYWIMAQAYKKFPTPSSVWQQPRRRASALHALANYHEINSWHPPPLLPDTPIEPLSDSESDDDDISHSLPTIQDTAELVNQRDESASPSQVEEKENQFDCNVVSDIPRDRARLDLYRAHISYRRQAEAKLKTRLDSFFLQNEKSEEEAQ